MQDMAPDELEPVFQSWIKTLINKTALHTVKTWSTQDQLILGQSAVEVKSNKITAIPILLKILVIENVIITLDALGYRAEIAK